MSWASRTRFTVDSDDGVCRIVGLTVGRPLSSGTDSSDHQRNYDHDHRGLWLARRAYAHFFVVALFSLSLGSMKGCLVICKR
jgi:hypothetical protein